MAKTFSSYMVANNSFKGNSITLRFAGDDSAPVFVAKDVLNALGYHRWSIGNATKNLAGACEIDRLKTSGIGNHIMIGITADDVEVLLSRKDTRTNPEKELKKETFRKFWRNEVLPQIQNPELRTKIRTLEDDNSELKNEVARLTALVEAYREGKITPFRNETA